MYWSGSVGKTLHVGAATWCFFQGSSNAAWLRIWWVGPSKTIIKSTTIRFLYPAGKMRFFVNYPSVTLTRCLTPLVLYSWFHIPGLLFLVWYSWFYLLSDFRFQILYFKFDISDFIFRISGFIFHISYLTFQISYLGFQISDVIFQSSGFTFHITDFRL